MHSKLELLLQAAEALALQGLRLELPPARVLQLYLELLLQALEPLTQQRPLLELPLTLVNVCGNALQLCLELLLQAAEALTRQHLRLELPPPRVLHLCLEQLLAQEELRVKLLQHHRQQRKEDLPTYINAKHAGAPNPKGISLAHSLVKRKITANAEHAAEKHQQMCHRQQQQLLLLLQRKQRQRQQQQLLLLQKQRQHQQQRQPQRQVQLQQPL